MTRDEFLASHGLTKTPKLAAMHLGQVEKWYRATAYDPVYTKDRERPERTKDLVDDFLKGAREYGTQQEIERLEELNRGPSLPPNEPFLDPYKWEHIGEGCYVSRTSARNNRYQRRRAWFDEALREARRARNQRYEEKVSDAKERDANRRKVDAVRIPPGAKVTQVCFSRRTA